MATLDQVPYQEQKDLTISYSFIHSLIQYTDPVHLFVLGSGDTVANKDFTLPSLSLSCPDIHHVRLVTFKPK